MYARERKNVDGRDHPLTIGAHPCRRKAGRDSFFREVDKNFLEVLIVDSASSFCVGVKFEEHEPLIVH